MVNTSSIKYLFKNIINIINSDDLLIKIKINFFKIIIKFIILFDKKGLQIIEEFFSVLLIIFINIHKYHCHIRF